MSKNNYDCIPVLRSVKDALLFLEEIEKKLNCDNCTEIIDLVHKVIKKTYKERGRDAAKVFIEKWTM